MSEFPEQTGLERPNGLYSIHSEKVIAGLDALLSGTGDWSELADYLSLNRVILGSGAFCLILARCGGAPNDTGLSPMDLGGIFAQQLESRLIEKTIYYLAPLRGLAVCVIAMPQVQQASERTEKMEEFLVRTCRETFDAMRSQEIPCLISLSPIFFGVEHLHGSFRRTWDHLNFRLFFQQPQGVYPANLSQPAPAKNYCFAVDLADLCRKTIHLLSANQFKGFYERVKAEILAISESVPFSLSQFKTECYEYMETLCALMIQMNIADLSSFSRTDLYGLIDLSDSFPALWQGISELLDKITQQYQLMLRQVRVPPAIRMRDYIDEHCTDPNLSITEVANRFHMSQPSFSAYFKQQLGVAPLTYLNQCRVKQVQTLLETTSLTLSQIAERSGFWTISSLHRVFKKETGTTPAHFRGPKHL